MTIADSFRRLPSVIRTLVGVFGIAALGALDVRADINYPSFPNSSGLVLLNSAVVGGGVLSVTPSTFAVSGQAWYQQPQDVQDPFRTTFQFQITDLQGLGPGPTGLPSSFRTRA